MKKEYAEINRGFVVGFHERDDHRPPVLAGRKVVKVRDDDDVAFKTIPVNMGDEYKDEQFRAPTRPNPNLEPPPPTDREILEETRDAVNRILDILSPGPP